MDYSDIVFWYTGLGVWSIIALVLAAAGIILCVVGGAAGYRNARSWLFNWRLACMPEPQRRRLQEAVSTAENWNGRPIPKSPEAVAYLEAMYAAMRKYGKTDPLINTDQKYRMGEWLELSNGWKVQVDWPESNGSYKTRLEGTQHTVRLAADGTVSVNRAVCVVGRCENPEVSFSAVTLIPDPLHNAKSVLDILPYVVYQMRKSREVRLSPKHMEMLAAHLESTPGYSPYVKPETDD